MFQRLSSRLETVPLAIQVIFALSVALLPLGVAALIAAFHSFAAMDALNSRVDALQALGVALPALMWIAAVAITSITLSQLVIRPLRRVRSTVDRYAAGNLDARLGGRRLFSPELAGVAAAFDAMADRAADHAHALEQALATQKALTREVHHRVKNNLQIVSSLLSLQASDAGSAEVAAAYALIRQRVNALALVHRWMYQEEGARGVELRPLLADLSANLEHGFDGRPGGSRRVSCDAERITVGQDTALPIAFLITELVGGSRATGKERDTGARIEAHNHGTKACLTVTSMAFGGVDGLDGFEDGTRRIITGLARQLRSPLRYDVDAHAFQIDFPAFA